MKKSAKGIIALLLGAAVVIFITMNLGEKNKAEMLDKKNSQSIQEKDKDNHAKPDGGESKESDDVNEEVQDKVKYAEELFKKMNNGEITQAELQEKLAEMGISVQKSDK